MTSVAHRIRIRTLCATVVAATVLATEAQGQSATCQFRGVADALSERPSPLDSVAIPLGAGVGKLCYGRPSARGRTIIGDQDPYGSPWRLGANEPTTLHLPFPARIGDVDVDPGSYTLYAIPDDGAWTIVVNGNTTRWGIPISPNVRRSDIGSFLVQTGTLDGHVEVLTFRFEGSGRAGDLVFEWERNTIRIPISRR